MTINTSTLRPGLLVNLKTSVSGNVSYVRQVIEDEHAVGDGLTVAKWETERTVTDAAELERAKKARSKASAAIRGVCAASAFGLLCPEIDAEKLAKAIEAARQITDEFNATAAITRVAVYVLTGRIAADDVEAVKAINSEISDLLATMADGVRRLDVKTIREAASKVREVGSMLSPDAEARVAIAIETARKTAKAIVAAGEDAAQEIDQSAIRKITEMRTAFLDLDDAKAIGTPAEAARALDLPSTLAME